MRSIRSNNISNESKQKADPVSVKQALKSPHQSLDDNTRSFMERRFDYNFSNVRIHAGADANNSAVALNAHAYTINHDIVFGHGEYKPATSAGKSLIAHELAHVIQQESNPVDIQKDLSIGKPFDKEEHIANTTARKVITPSYQSHGLKIRNQLRNSPLPHQSIQRAVKTWGGEYDTDKYELVKNLGTDGVKMELKFTPNKYVDAKLISMTQTARSTEKGVPVPASTFYGKDAEKKAFESYRIPAKEPNAGTMVDQLVQFKNPLFATGATGAKDTLATTLTNAGWGQHGWRYTDKTGKLQKQNALLKDTPTLPSAMKESGQIFESTAVAIKGVQEGTYYGSVQWGWTKDAAGKANQLPLSIVSNDVPSATFARAVDIWNAAKTAKAEDTINLPLVTGKYTNTPGVWLVSNPSLYATSIIGKLHKNTRLEVIDKGTDKSFNKSAEKDKWWKVSIVDGTYIGKVGWIMQANLSDAKTK